jgi:glutaredoxin
VLRRLLSRRVPVEVVTFVTRQGCHLCAQAEPVVRAAAEDAGARFDRVDVDLDPRDRERWTEKVPVVLLDGVEHAYWHVDERALRAALEAGRPTGHPTV